MSLRRIQLQRGKRKNITFPCIDSGGYQTAANTVVVETRAESTITVNNGAAGNTHSFEIQLEDGIVVPWSYVSPVTDTNDQVAEGIRLALIAALAAIPNQVNATRVNNVVTVQCIWYGVSTRVTRLSANASAVVAITVVPTIGSLHWTAYNHRNEVVEAGQCDTDTSNGYTILIVPLGLSGIQYSTLGRGYRVQARWRLSDLEPLIDNLEVIYFDVVRLPWSPVIDLEFMKTMHISIAMRLTKHGQFMTPVRDADYMLAKYVDNALDIFDLIIREYVLEDRLPAEVDLIPDPGLFNRVVALLVVACVMRADGRDDKYDIWKSDSEKLFSKYSMIKYDQNADGLADTEIIAPDKGTSTKKSDGLGMDF
jgi:hypothetical protein